MASCPAVAYRNRARLMNGLSVGLAWKGPRLARTTIRLPAGNC